MIYICCCGKFYNSDTLKECPFCHAPKEEQNDFVKELAKDEGFVITVKTIADNVAHEIMNQHEENYEHKEVKCENEN